MQAGADIVTVPPKFFPQMCAHPKTDEAVQPVRQPISANGRSENCIESPSPPYSGERGWG